MRAPVATGLAVLALAFATGALAVSIVRPTPKPPARQPYGVCVVTDPYAFGTDGGGPYAAVRSVTQATRTNGVVTCEAGTYVPVAAK